MSQTAPQAVWRAFVEVLEQEHAALLGGNVDALPALAERKLALATSISESNPAATQASAVRALMRKAHALSRDNALLLNVRLGFVERALTALRGAGDTALYGADGRSQLGIGTRASARA